MRFGHFDDSMKEYVIERPDVPYPWINYLGNENFFSLISNTSGGYCFYKDAKLLRLTRYRYNNVPTDAGGRYFYINDGSDVWSIGWMPVKHAYDEYSCRHGLGYSIISSTVKGVRAEQTSFVPLGSNCEVHRIRIKNENTSTISIKLFSFVEFCLWNALDDSTNFQRNYSTGEVEIVNSTIYHKTEYRERRNHYAIFSVNCPIDGYDTDRESFIGMYNGFDHPKAVFDGSCSNSKASGWSPIGSHEIKMSLAPGEERSFIFVLGYCENDPDKKWESPNVINKDPATALLKKFQTDIQVDSELERLSEYWKNLLSVYSLKSDDDKLNRMVNIWNQYQCMVTFNMSRSASYFESGIGRGMGFRDSAQDLMGFVHLIPDRARKRILDIASTQMTDGSAYHQYQPLTKKGNSDIGSGFNDDPLWLIFGTAAYIKETGDISILDVSVPYDSNINNVGTLFEHLKKSFRHVTDNLGPHSLPLIGRADWNDCLNLNCFSDTPGESFQTTENRESGIAESVFIAGMFCAVAPDYIKMCNLSGDKDEAEFAMASQKNMYDAVIKDGWDGEWFIRAYDAFGNKVGSHSCSEGKIFIEPQGFCIMGNIGIKEGYAERALNSTMKYLDTKYGILLNQPPYTKYHIELGEISSYPPGYKENAGIFCHNNPWISIAETKIGRGDRAFEIYRKTCPAYLEEISEIHRTEPYVYSQMIAGKDAKNFGQAKNSWLTGTAAWTFYNISQCILGISPDWDSLIIDPCIPKSTKGFTVTRKFRKDTYIIKVINESGCCKGIKYMIVDGKKTQDNRIVPFGDGKEHKIEAYM